MKNLLRKLGMKMGVPALALAAMLNTSCPNMDIKPTLNVNLPEGPYSHSVQVFNNYQPDEEDNNRWIQIGEKESSFELNPYQSYCFEGIIHSSDIKPDEIIILTYKSKEKHYVWAQSGKTHTIDFTFDGLLTSP